MFKKLWNEIQGIYVTTKIRLWCAELRHISWYTMKDKETFESLYWKVCQYDSLLTCFIRENLAKDPTSEIPKKVATAHRKAQFTMEYIKFLAKTREIDISNWRKMYSKANREVKEL